MESNCVLCLNKIIENPRTNNPRKFSKLCSKYLHFAFTQKTLQPSHSNLLFCQKCFESVVELAHFNEQVEYYQRKISELVSLLENLYHRQRIINTDNKSEIIISKNIFTDNLGNSLQFSEIVNDENIVNAPHYVDVKFEITEQLFIDDTAQTESLMLEENEEENASTSEVESKHWPILKLERSQSTESRDDYIIVAESDMGFPNEQNKTSWFKINSVGNYGTTSSNRSSSTSKNCQKTSGTSTKSAPITTPPHFTNQIPAQKTINDYKIPCATSSRYFHVQNTKKTEAKHSGSHNYKISEEQSNVDKQIFSEIPAPAYQKEFKSQDYLSKHKLVRRRGDYPYSCDVCKKVFKESAHVIVHKRIHTGETYRCDVCNKSFTQRGTFFNHKKVHSRELFKCDYCGKDYSMKHAMLRHRRSHFGEKAFKCDQCDYASDRADILKSHKMNRHYFLNKFKCRECEQCFQFSPDVETHYKMVHFALDFSDDCVIKIF